MVIAILLLVLGSQVLPSECDTFDICSVGGKYFNAARINISSPGYPNDHEIPPDGLSCHCVVNTITQSTAPLKVSLLEVSYRACDGQQQQQQQQQQQCDSSCWSSLNFSNSDGRSFCLPQFNLTTGFTLRSSSTNVTYAAKAKNPAFTYRGRFLISIRDPDLKNLQISCNSDLMTTTRHSTNIQSTSSTTRRKSRTRTSGTTPSTTRSSTGVSRTESTTSGSTTRSTGSTRTTASSSTSTSVDSESSTLSSTLTASTTVSTTATTTTIPGESTIVGETTTSTATDRSTTASDATTSMATETVTDTAATSTAPGKITTATVSNPSTASETKEFTTDTRTSMASAASSSGTDSSSRPTTSSTLRGTSADVSTAAVVSLDFDSSAVHSTSEYPKPFPSETSFHEDSTTAETSTATPVPSRKLLMLAIILAVLIFVLILIIIIICCVRKSRRKAKMSFEGDLCVVRMSDLENDVQSPDVQPIISPGQRLRPLPLQLLLQKTSKKHRGEASAAAAAADKGPCCSYKRQPSNSYAPMGSNTAGRVNNNKTGISPNVYADLEKITGKQQRGGHGLEHGTASNPIITITDTDCDYYNNRPRSASQQSDPHAYETCYSPDGATMLSASSEYEHTYASIQGRKGSVDSLKTESPYSTISEDQLYSNIGEGQSEETDTDKKMDEDQ